MTTQRPDSEPSLGEAAVGPSATAFPTSRSQWSSATNAKYSMTADPLVAELQGCCARSRTGFVGKSSPESR